jgi:hypothetical protein
MSLANAGLPAPFFRTFTVNPAATSILADKVFPFLDGYGAYAGDCDANNPGNYQDDYFQTPPGDAALATTDPNGSASVVARLPSINIEVQSSCGTVQAGARVFLMENNTDDTDCSSPAWSSTTASPWRQTAGDGVNPTASPVAKGALPAPWFPFGKYLVCADNNLTGTSKRYTGKIAIDNLVAAGTTKKVLNYLSGSVSANQKLCTDP